MATKKANPNTQRVMGTLLGSVLADRGMKMAGPALAGLDGLGAFDLSKLSYKKAGLAAAVTVGGAMAATKSTNPLISGLATGAAAAAANHLADEAAAVFGGSSMSGLGAGNNLDIYEDTPFPTGMRGIEDPQFTGSEPQFV